MLIDSGTRPKLAQRIQKKMETKEFSYIGYSKVIQEMNIELNCVEKLKIFKIDSQVFFAYAVVCDLMRS